MAISELLENMSYHNIKVLCISEHHLAMQHHVTRQLVSETFKKTNMGSVKYQFDSGPEHDNRGRKMGGTGIISIESVVGRICPMVESERDPMGRWSVIHLRRHQQTPLSIISVYQVCQSPTNAIGDTAWHQQRRYLDLHMRNEHPRVAFINDITKYIQQLQRRQHAIIVGGDWNDWIGSPNSPILRMCTSLQLLEPWTINNPQDIDFATHEQGQHRIDSVFVSPEIHHTIKAIRYTPGGLLCSTDHRAILVDFHTAMLFGNIMPAQSQQIPRSIRANDKKAVTIFVENMYNHLSQHNAFQQSKLLATSHGTHALAEHLDKLIGEAGNLGEKRCRRRRAVWYSSTLAETRYTVSVLRHYVKGLRVHSDRSRVVRERLQRIQVQIYLPTTLEAAQQLLATYEDRLRDEIQKAEPQRRSALSVSADTAIQQGHMTKAKVIRNINKCERNLRTWKVLKFMSNNGKSQKLDRLDIPRSWQNTSVPTNSAVHLEDPKAAQEWITITDPAAIEHYLLLRNYQHFGQAYGTPFTLPPLSEDLNWSGTSKASDEILSGTYHNPSIRSNLCQNLLKQCAASVALDGVPAVITSQEFQGKIKSWNERTTTSPSGRHLGRYKALYATAIYEHGTEEASIFAKKQKAIEGIILHILNYCISQGYPLKRWCQIVNTLIFKDHGNYQVHRLRVIHIFEADLNLLYATKWRQLIRHADDQRCIHPGQYGGRPGYEATSLALLEELRLDVSFMTRRTLVTFDNDAASCYDRIVINFASLVNRKYGLHKELTQLHGRILQATEYKLRTAVGISSASYRNSPDRPLYGTGQGAGNSPGIWLLISAALFDTFTTSANGADFTSADGTVQTHMGITGFVDDTNVVVNNFSPQHEPPHYETIEKLRQDAQLWTHILYLSGGKLELTKCSYHALQFKFHADGTPIAIPDPKCPDLELQDPSSNNGMVAVPFLPSTTAHKILGHWKAPADPRQTKQIQILMSQAENVSLLIAVSPLSRYGARLAYIGKYVSSLRYVLPQCWFPQAKLVTAEKKSMHRIISKCGYARTTPTALIFAPKEYAGAGFVHWYTIQGEGQVKHFIKHWRTQTYESKMLRICVSWAQWQSGLGKSILADVTTPIPHLESRWLSSLRTFLAHVQGHIDLDQTFIPPLERPGDIHVMEFAIQSGAFNDREIRVLNYCRLYIHVATISELINSTGTHIMRHMFECERPPWFNKDTPVIIQQRPSLFQRRYQWQRFCRLICREDLSLGEATQLGPCIPLPSSRLRREAYVNASNSTEYMVWRQHQYWMAKPHPKLPRQIELCHPASFAPDEKYIPVDIIQRHSPRRCSVAPISIPQPHQPRSNALSFDFADFSLTLEQWEQDLLQHITWIKQPFQIMHYLHHQRLPGENLLIVSDGSSQEQITMSYGLVLGTSSGHTLLEAMGPAWGQPSSHRAECTGCLAGAILLKYLSKFTMTGYPKDMGVIIISDNQGMINSLTQRTTYDQPYPNSTLTPDWELLEEIYHTYQTISPVEKTFEWIRGHQDRGNPTQLSVEAKYNIRADHLAGEYCIMVESRLRQLSPLMPQTKCILYLQNTALHGHYESAIRRASAAREYFSYLKQRHDWSHSTLMFIDWTVFQRAARNYHSTEVHLLKLVHDKLPTNHAKARYQAWTSPQCHFCSQPETFEHLCLSICNPRSQSFRSQLKTRVGAYFTASNTPKTFRASFEAAMDIWMSQLDPTAAPQWTGPLALFHEQQTIGWKQMFRGFLSRQWRQHLRRCIQEDTNVQWCERNIGSHTDHDDQDTFVVTFDDSSGVPAMNHWRDPHHHLAGLTKLIWDELGDMWRKHTNFIHQDGSSVPNSRRMDLCNHIRYLHKFKEKTLAAHRDRYFFSDVEAYLRQATSTQMHQYITQYRPVILNSIRQATKIATQALNLTQFPGFTAASNSTRTIHVSQEEAQHRKHTRLRNLIPSRITTYFRTKTTPPPPPENT